MNTAFNGIQSAGIGVGLAANGGGETNVIAPSGGFVDIHNDLRQSALQETEMQTEDHPNDEAELLRERIRVLESTVQMQNVKIQEYETLKRNYAATVTKLSDTSTEKDVIEEDRDRYYKEMMFYREQASQKTKENDVNKERMQEMYKHLRECDKKIRLLENQVCFWKGKYENYRKDEKDHGKRSQMTQVVDSVSSSDKRTRDHDHLKRRRHTFHQTPTVLPRCRNCSAVFDRVQPYEIQCRFHRSAPQPLKTWIKQLNGDKKRSAHLDSQPYMFWPCCQKEGLKEPPGCMKLRDHDLITPEEG